MVRDLVIEGTAFSRAARNEIVLPVGTDVFGGNYGIPLVILRGATPGPIMAVDACCHGDEPEGTRALFELMRRVKPHELAGTLVLAPALNLAAVAAMQRGNPHDHWNGDLNRLFPGSPDGNLTQRTAYAYFNSILRQADFVISLHSGASYILWSHEVLTSARDAKSLALAQALGRDWDVVRYTDGFAGSCSAACHDAGITAISIEVGGAAQRSVAEYGLVVDLIVDALLNGLRTLGMLDGEASAAERWILVEDEAIRSSISGFVVFEDRLRLRCEVQRGETLAKLYNAHGVELQAIAAPFDGLLMGMRTYTYAPAGWPLVWLARPTKTITRTL